MKKYITYFLMAAALIGGATACNEDDLTKESMIRSRCMSMRMRAVL